jgi:hypothetical protein
VISSAPRIWYSKRWVKYFVRGKIYVISSAPRIWYSKRWVKYFVRGKIYVISSCDSVLLPHTQTNQYRTRVIPFICHIYICIPVILYMYTGHFIYVYRSYYICIPVILYMYTGHIIYVYRSFYICIPVILYMYPRTFQRIQRVPGTKYFIHISPRTKYFTYTRSEYTRTFQRMFPLRFVNLENTLVRGGIEHIRHTHTHTHTHTHVPDGGGTGGVLLSRICPGL